MTQEILGSWQGHINLSSAQLQVELILEAGPQGEVQGTMDIPAQRARGLPLTGIAVEGRSIRFSIGGLPGNPTFKGKLSNEATLEGTFTQAGQTFDFVVQRKETGELTAQTVAGLIERQVRVSVTGGELGATLTLPAEVDSSAPTQACVLVAGSGPTDRDGNNPLLPFRPDTLKQLAHRLVQNGTATLRYDKRGIGQSSGLVEKGATPPLQAFVDDVGRCLDYLRQQPVVAEEEVFAIGHSEGGLLASMAVAEGARTAGLVLVASPGRKLGETLRSQVRVQAQAAQGAGGEPDQKGLEERAVQALDDLYCAIDQDRSFELSTYELPEALEAILMSLDTQRPFVKPWLRVDPPGVLQNVDVPVCIIQGDEDTQVSPADARALAGALPDEQVELHVLPGVGHLGTAACGTDLDEELVALLSEFIAKHTGEK